MHEDGETEAILKIKFDKNMQIYTNIYKGPIMTHS